MKQIESSDLPAPVGPYSHAIAVGDLLFVSGQLGLDPQTGELAGDGVEAQTRQVLDNIEKILKLAGMDWSCVVKVEIYLKNLDDFATVNHLYGKRLSPFKPARQTMEVSRLPLDVKVEISCIAHK